MGQSATFTSIKMPYVAGVCFGVSITSPSSASEDVGEWLAEISEAMRQLDGLIETRILRPAEDRRFTEIQREAGRALILTTTIQRELAITKGVVDALTPYLPNTCEPEPAAAPPSPVSRHVALMRAEEKWSAAVNAWRAGDNEPMPTEAEAADAHLDEVGELFIALIETPAPTVDAVMEKAALARRTGYFRTEEFADALSRDLAALVERGSAPADFHGVEA